MSPIFRSGTLSTLGANDDSRLCPPVGTIIDRLYKVESTIGKTPRGAVVQATDVGLQRSVVIKFLRPSAANIDVLRERLEREARVMASVRHENVVEVYAFGEHEGVPYIVMEHIEGIDSRTWIDAYRDARERPPPHEVLRLLDQVCAGVGAIHKAGALHGDIKPSNVLLGPAFRAAVSDFGLARILEGDTRLSAVGTRGAYLAPEMAIDVALPRETLVRSDIFSIGVLAYELLTGSVPSAIDGRRTSSIDQLSKVRAELGPEFGAPIGRALSLVAEERHANADELRADLTAALSKHQSARKPIVLIADDDPIFVELLKAIIESSYPGCEIMVAMDGSEALNLALDHRPILFIVDMDMPIMNGLELTQALRERPLTNGTPIIIASGEATAADWQQLARLGAQTMLMKPVQPIEVTQAVKRALPQRELARLLVE